MNTQHTAHELHSRTNTHTQNKQQQAKLIKRHPDFQTTSPTNDTHELHTHTYTHTRTRTHTHIHTHTHPAESNPHQPPPRPVHSRTTHIHTFINMQNTANAINQPPPLFPSNKPPRTARTTRAPESSNLRLRQTIHSYAPRHTLSLTHTHPRTHTHTHTTHTLTHT